jgi:hypothetical protein
MTSQIYLVLTSCDLNLESSNFLMAYFMSSWRTNSQTPVPSCWRLSWVKLVQFIYSNAAY